MSSFFIEIIFMNKEFFSFFRFLSPKILPIANGKEISYINYSQCFFYPPLCNTFKTGAIRGHGFRPSAGAAFVCHCPRGRVILYGIC
jgi:hypothetical protein